MEENITTLKENNPNHLDQLQKIDEGLKDLSLQVNKKVNENTLQSRIKSLTTEYIALKEQCKSQKDQSDSLEEHIVNLFLRSLMKY